MKRLIPFLLLFLSAASHAESGAYLVEVIVFQNLEEIAEPLTTDKLRSFSQHPDLTRKTPTQTSSIPEELRQIIPDDLPDDFLIKDDKSAYMDDVWRRLRSSRGYRPLLFSAWQQNRVDYYPPVRIHNDDLLDTELRHPATLLVADLTAEDPLARYRTDFYQIEGSVQLRRSRFLHIYLDLEYRQKPTIAPTATLSQRTENLFVTDVADSELVDEQNNQYGVHRLKQNRQVRTGQLHYFDTPYFGALVFVSPINSN